MQKGGGGGEKGESVNFRVCTVLYSALVRGSRVVEGWIFFFCILRKIKSPRGSTKARVAGRQSAWKGVVRDAGAPIKTRGSKSSPASATPRDRESV